MEHVTSKYNQMLYVNLGSAVISSGTVILSGRFGSALSFAAGHPGFVRDAATLSAAAVGGQWFIYSQVKEFGALVFAATMNVRQVVSILISYAHYGHSITMLQVLGLIVIFSALFYKSFSGLFKSSSGEKQALLPKKEEEVEEKGVVPPAIGTEASAKV